MSYPQNPVVSSSLLDIERPAWITAIAMWVVGDLVTTAIGFSLGAAEANPLSATVIGSFGPWVLIPMQLVALFAFGTVWWMLRERDVVARVGIPIGLSITGMAIVANNLVVIAALV